MANKLHFTLVSPERELMAGDVDQVDVPGTEGRFGVLAAHAPFMTTLAPGVVLIRNGAETTRIFVRGGFADVTPAGLTILAEEAVPLKELDAARLAERMRNAEQDLADADAAPETRLAAQRELAALQEMRAAL